MFKLSIYCRKHDYEHFRVSDINPRSSLQDTDVWSVETDGASSSSSSRSRSSGSRQERQEDDGGVVILDSRVGGAGLGRVESREALDLSKCSGLREVLMVH